MTSAHRSPRERRRAAAAPGAPPWLIAADADEAGGSVLSLTGATPAAAERVGFGAAAQAAWRDAHRAAATGLPLRWRSLDGLSSPPAWARRVDRRRMSGAAAKAVAEVVDGPSFGLGMFLAIACGASGLPARADVVALAALTAEGALRSVGGLRSKLWLVGRALPQVRTVLVAATQQAEADAIAGELRQSGALSADCAVVGLRDASEAIAVALDGTADAAIRDAASDPARRHEWIATLCHLALDGHDRISHWPPIAAATTAACEAFAPAASDPIDDDYALLQIADVVAHRHATEPRRWPSLELLQRLPLPRRLMVLAHATQHAADVGDPEPAALQPFLDAHLAQDPDAFEVHCRVAGAWGRLLAARGEPEQALAWQRFAARQRLAIGAPQGMGHPLAEWLRLAGMLGDAAAVDEARALRARAEALGAVGPRDRPFLALADARADLGLGRDGADARLAAVMDDLDAPLHVRHSAARLLAVTAPTTAARRAAATAALAEPHREPVARLFAALARLDEVAIGAAERRRASGDEATVSAVSAVSAAIATLQAALPGPLQHLRASLPAGADDAALAAAISRNFPY